MIELFRIIGRIGIEGRADAEEDLDHVTETAEGSSDKILTAFKKLGKAIIGIFAIDKIKDFGVTIVQTAANVQAETAQFEAAFKDLAGSATDMFNRVSESTGIFATRLQVTGTKAYAQLKGAGLDANTALQETEVFLNLASDAAAYYDISLEDAEERIRSFMRGNVEAGDAIGLFTSESQRNNYAVETYGKKWIELTEAQKQLLMLNISQDIYDQSGATGQAARESDGLANVVGNLKEVWRQFLAVVGQPILEKVIPIMQKLTTVAETMKTKVGELKAWIEDNRETVEKWKNAIEVTTVTIVAMWAALKAGTIIMQVTAWIKAANAALIAYKAATAASGTVSLLLAQTLSAGQLIWGVLTGKVTLATVATLAQAKAQAILNAVMTANPIGLVIAAIALLVGAFVLLWKNCEGFRNFWIGMWDGIKQVVSAVVNWVKETFATVKQWFITNIAQPVSQFYNKWIAPVVNKIIEIVKKVVEIIGAAFVGLHNLLSPKIASFFAAIGNFASTAWEKIKSVFAPVVSWFREKFQGAYDTVKKVFSPIAGFFSGVWNKVKNTFSGLGTKIGNAIGGAVKTAINGVISMIERTINKAIGLINGAINIINKLPGVDVSKISTLKMPRLAKGGVLEKGQVGLLEGSGAEAVVPLERNKKWLSKVAEDLNVIGGGSDAVYTLQRLIDMLAAYFPQILESMQKDVVLDDGTLVGKMAPKMNQKLAAMQAANARGR